MFFASASSPLQLGSLSLTVSVSQLLPISIFSWFISLGLSRLDGCACVTGSRRNGEEMGCIILSSLSLSLSLGLLSPIGRACETKRRREEEKRKRERAKGAATGKEKEGKKGKRNGGGGNYLEKARLM